MSLPLSRRIARAAFVVAAGAAPVVGAAGAAGAVELPTQTLGELSALDTQALPETAGTVSDTAGSTGGAVLENGTEAAGQLTETAGPVAEGALGQAQETAGETAGHVGSGLPTEGLGATGLF